MTPTQCKGMKKEIIQSDCCGVIVIEEKSGLGEKPYTCSKCLMPCNRIPMTPTQSNNQSLYTKLTSRINELLGGDLKKLEFGCELKAENPTKYRRFYTGSNQEEGEVFFIDADQTGCEDQYWYREGEIEEHEIIGRDPSLSDVLRSIWIFSVKDEKTGVNVIPCKGTISLSGAITDLLYPDHWDLTKHLSGQSQETQEWLLNLLSGK